MPWHTAQQGEWIAQIAQQYGFSDPKVISDHADNADLKKKRPDPNLLLPGDRLFVPDKDEKEVDIATGKAHRFKVKLPKTTIKVIVHGDDDQPLANKPYKLTLDDAVYEGTSDGDGLIEVKIPLKRANGGQLEIDGNTIPIRLGHLDPLDEISGIQARFHNLGYDCGPIGEEPGEAFAEAIERFQAKVGLEVTGDLDDATKSKLADAHGC